MSLKVLSLVLILLAPQVMAETFMGRTVGITDGRTDTTRSGPLIIALHGFLGTPRSMRRKTQFDQLARSNGFVVAYPEGVHRKWNDGRDPGAQVDDVGYLAALIARLVADGRIDPS